MAEVNEDRWCFAWLADAQAASESTRAALVKGNKWQSGDTIRFRFWMAPIGKRDWCGALPSNGSLDWRTLPSAGRTRRTPISESRSVTLDHGLSSARPVVT